jgi:hypothetical protein
MDAMNVETADDLDRYLERSDPTGEKLDRLVDVLVGRRVESWADYCNRLDRDDDVVRMCEVENK